MSKQLHSNNPTRPSHPKARFWIDREIFDHLTRFEDLEEKIDHYKDHDDHGSRTGSKEYSSNVA